MGLVAPRHVGSSGPGIEPMLPAFSGELSTPGPPGKFPRIVLAIWGLGYLGSCFQTSFKMTGSRSLKFAVGNLIGIALNL